MVLRKKNQAKTDRGHLPTDYTEIRINKQVLYTWSLFKGIENKYGKIFTEGKGILNRILNDIKTNIL